MKHVVSTASTTAAAVSAVILGLTQAMQGHVLAEGELVGLAQADRNR